MMKKIYVSPILLGLVDHGDGEFVVGSSVEARGLHWKFEGIDEETLNLIKTNCGDLAFSAMDTDNNQIITLQEFEYWFTTVKGGKW